MKIVHECVAVAGREVVSLCKFKRGIKKRYTKKEGNGFKHLTIYTHHILSTLLLVALAVAVTSSQGRRNLFSLSFLDASVAARILEQLEITRSNCFIGC